MEELDLAKFTWINSKTKYNCHIITITEYKDESVVIFYCRQNPIITIQSVSDFCATHEAVHKL